MFDIPSIIFLHNAEIWQKDHFWMGATYLFDLSSAGMKYACSDVIQIEFLT